MIIILNKMCPSIGHLKVVYILRWRRLREFHAVFKMQVHNGRKHNFRGIESLNTTMYLIIGHLLDDFIASVWEEFLFSLTNTWWKVQHNTHNMDLVTEFTLTICWILFFQQNNHGNLLSTNLLVYCLRQCLGDVNPRTRQGHLTPADEVWISETARELWTLYLVLVPQLYSRRVRELLHISPKQQHSPIHASLPEKVNAREEKKRG